MDMDFVDMNDPHWQYDFAPYSGKINNKKNEVLEARFRENRLLKFWFRARKSLHVRKVHFVTCRGNM
jgi:hypothetical protein